MTTERVLPRVSLGLARGSVTPAFTAPSADVPGAVASTASPTVAVPTVVAPTASAPGVETIPPAVASAARFARPRREALFGTPTRAAVLVGVSAAVYAVSLATVSGLQSQSLADAVADTQPGLDAVARAKAANDQIESQLKDADARLRALAADYDATSTDVTAYQAQFEQLSALVAKIQGSAAKMNANFKLPSVTIRGSVGSSGGSSVVTTTSGSGKP